jgi:transposase
VLGTDISASELSAPKVIAADKSQSWVEGGFRFLKDPLRFVSSLFVKKPSRMEALLMVMTLTLLVYSVTQRRLRQPFAEHHETVPNQISSTDTVADLAVGLPTVGRYSPCPGDGARSSP